MRTIHRATKKPTCILTADWHLREDTPVCRMDDYWKAQAEAIEFIYDLQLQHTCPIIHAGDMFDHWKPSPFLLAWAIEYLPDEIHVVPGQHDLPQHNLDLLSKSGLNVLEKAGRVKCLGEGIRPLVGDSTTVYGYAWGQTPQKIAFTEGCRDILVLHTMTWTHRIPFPGCKADSAHALLKKLSGYDLIVTGDNHQPFIVEHEGRVLCNPGSMMQMAADQQSHKPRVYLYYAEDNSVQPVYLPSSSDYISREHIDRAEERDQRVEAFVSRLKDDFEIGLSFEKNLKEYFEKNKAKKEVKDLVWKAVET